MSKKPADKNKKNKSAAKGAAAPKNSKNNVSKNSENIENKKVKSKKAKSKKIKNKKPVTKKTAKKNKGNNTEKNILTRFFSHNITLLVLSFILSFTIWFIISASSETDSNVTISNIPVSIELSDTARQDGLEIFIGDDVTASVEVSGNRVTVGSLSASDIQISAGQTSAIIAPGTYTLPLTAKKTGIKSNYEIVSSVSPSTVTVYVDRRKEVEYAVENRLTVELEDGNHYASTSLSQNNVTLNGPETQMNQIDAVAVLDTINAGSDETKTVQEGLKYLDVDGNVLEFPMVKADVETIEATVTVMPVMNVRLSVDMIGQPKNCPDITITPQSVKIAGPQTSLSEIRDGTISIGTLDFSKLKNEKISYPYDISLPNGCKVISGETSATVKVDLSRYVKGTVNAKITSGLDSSKYSVEFNSNTVAIEIFGPESLVNAIAATNVTVVADFYELMDSITADKAVSLSVPLSIKFSSKYAECWAYGTYTVTANVTMK